MKKINMGIFVGMLVTALIGFWLHRWDLGNQLEKRELEILKKYNDDCYDKIDMAKKDTRKEVIAETDERYKSIIKAAEKEAARKATHIADENAQEQMDNLRQLHNSQRKKWRDDSTRIMNHFIQQVGQRDADLDKLADENLAIKNTALSYRQQVDSIQTVVKLWEGQFNALKERVKKQGINRSKYDGFSYKKGLPIFVDDMLRPPQFLKKNGKPSLKKILQHYKSVALYNPFGLAGVVFISLILGITVGWVIKKIFFFLGTKI